MNNYKLCGKNDSVFTDHFISPCSLQLYLACPIHAVLAAVNVFYIAKHAKNHLCPLEKLSKANQLFSVLIVVVVITQIICSATGLQTYHSISYYLFLGFITFAWLLTSIYLQMKNRPPLFLCFLLILSWATTITELSILIIQLDSFHMNGKHHRVENYGCIVRLSLQTLAIIATLILRIKWIPNNVVNQRLHAGIQAESSETDRLLGSGNFQVYYSGISNQQSANELVEVDENCSLLSRTTFYWVYKLMKKGLKGSINIVEDLFYLPASLSTK